MVEVATIVCPPRDCDKPACLYHFFASEESIHRHLWFSWMEVSSPLSQDGLAHDWPLAQLYAFPPLPLILPTLHRVLQQGHRLLCTIMNARAPSPVPGYRMPTSGNCFLSVVHTSDWIRYTAQLRWSWIFLQNLLDGDGSHSTLKVYIATISSHHILVDNGTVGSHRLVSLFLRGARRLHPLRVRNAPVWDLPLVLDALCQHPFEPLAQA